MRERRTGIIARESAALRTQRRVSQHLTQPSSSAKNERIANLLPYYSSISRE